MVACPDADDAATRLIASMTRKSESFLRTFWGPPSSTDSPITVSPRFSYRDCMLERCGMLARHGPHHVAQKSTITGLFRSSAERSALPSSVLTLNEGAWRAAAATGARERIASAAAVMRSEVAGEIMALLVGSASNAGHRRGVQKL